MSLSNPIILVDGSSYLFRAFFGMPNLTNANNEPTGAIYGVVNMLKSLIKEYQPEYMAVVFDAKGKTFRNDMYAEYKANRPKMPDELRCQIEPLHQLIQELGLALISVSGVEADDVLGTLAVIEAERGNNVLISTGDKDLAQLVNDKVHLINTMTNVISDVEQVNEKFGVRPDQIKDYLALVGDTADNVPGIVKCGPKTAVKWLAEYNDIETLIENADKIKGKIGENLRAGIEQLHLSYELVTLDLTVELTDDQLNYKIQPENKEALAESYQHWGFNRWLDNLQAEQGVDATGGILETIEEVEKHYETILTSKQLDQWINKIKQAGYVCVDTETTGLDYMTADLVGFSFCIEAHSAAYLPLRHDYLSAPDQLDFDETIAKLKPLLEDESIEKIGQNLKYDSHILLRAGITLKGIKHDTMLQSYVLNSVASRHNMDDLALKHLGIQTIKFEDIAGKGKKQLTFNQIELDVASNYAAEDADITYQLHQSFLPRLQAEPSLLKLYNDIEIPVISVLNSIEQNGVLLKPSILQVQAVELKAKIKTIQKKAHELAEEEFNLSSPKQIQHIFFEKLGLPVIRKTPKGAPSTAEDVLETLAIDYPLPKIILEYRTLSKLLSTYVDKLPKVLQPSTGRIHTSYHQAVAATGRLSSTDPNLQNIPIKTEEGRRVRLAFVPPEGYTMLASDYSQIELRIMAHLSQDESLLNAFKNNIDVHSATASEVFATPIDEVTREQRRSAKAINFGLIYGMSAFGLAKQLGTTRPQAQDYINMYFERYPGVKNYMDNMKEIAKEQGYVETVFGRRLYLPEINARNAMRRQYAERTAINAPMQGTASDIIKRAMINIHNAIKERSNDVKMIMQVHDELVFEVKNDKLDEIKTLIENLMESAADLSVPLLVESGTGINWQEAH
jgi:DNA polymerase-1